MSYVVRSGDTLGAIASRHGTTVDEILSANPSLTNPNRIFPGQQLAIPGAAPPPVSSYVVQRGDTLSGIAARNGTTLDAMRQANPQLADPDRLAVGQQLNVPRGASGPPGSTVQPRPQQPAPRPQQPAPRPQQPRPPQQQEPAPPQPAPQNRPVNDPNWTLPDRGEARRLAPADFDAAARELGCEVAAVRAVSEVEAGGRTGFDAQNRPKILFEIHKFRKHTKRRYDASHPHLSAPYESPRRRQSYRKDQWAVIREAFALDADAALKSASWGMFQVLGENYQMCGWTSVRQFVQDMYLSEGQHMRAFLGYCRGAKLVRHIRTKSWAAFAAGYNGPDYASNSYDTKMANAYRRYSSGR